MSQDFDVLEQDSDKPLLLHRVHLEEEILEHMLHLSPAARVA